MSKVGIKKLWRLESISSITPALLRLALMIRSYFDGRSSEHPLVVFRNAMLILTVVLGSATFALADFPSESNFVLKGISLPYQIELGDLNNDGRIDLAIASWAPPPEKAWKAYNHADSKVLLHYQNSEGRFNSKADQKIHVTTPWGMLAKDFDGDGKTDLAIKEIRRKLHLYLGAEKFEKQHSSVSANDLDRYVFEAPLIGDEGVDFLTGGAIRKWHGGDDFKPGYCHGPTKNDNIARAIADLNQDGENDVIFLASGAIRIYFGPFTDLNVRPTDLSEMVEITPPAPVNDIQVADLTGDGRLDIVASLFDQKTGKRAVVLYPQWNSKPVAILDGISGQLITADFNQDKLTDLIVADSSNGKLHLFLQSRGATLRDNINAAYQTLKIRCSHAQAGDLNGDGYPDLAVSDGKNTVRFYLSDGTFDLSTIPAPPVIARQVIQAIKKESAVEYSARVQKEAQLEIKSLLSKLPAAIPGPDHIDPLRMPFYTGQIMPTPQKVRYENKTFSLKHTELLLNDGLKLNDPLVGYLRERIERYKGTLQSELTNSDTQIELKIQPSGREQAYSITWDGTKAILSGNDRQGLLWAIASFNQLVHSSKTEPVVRVAEVHDYPVSAKRGFIAGDWLNAPAYCLAFKINKPVFQTALVGDGKTRQAKYDNWREPLNDRVKAGIKTYSEGLTPFGIEWYAGHNPIVAKDKIESGSEADYNVVLDWAMQLEAIGGHLSLKYDDHRFPISAEDQRRFGSARAADSYLLKRLSQDLTKQYPKARVLFCPPFYWGPDSPAFYPEDRDDYLFELGSKLPANIDLFWTGPRVKSHQVNPGDVSWVRQLLQRNPVYWQNAFGTSHSFFYHYVTDPIPVLNDWYYDGFLNEIDCYMFNCLMPGYAAAAGASVDYAWNPKAYDPEYSIREMATKLVGSDTYPALIALNKSLSYFDRYGLRRTPGAAKRLPELEAKLSVVNAIWTEIETNRNIAAVDRWTSMRRHRDQVNRFVNRVKNSPDLAAYREDASNSLKRAIAEVGYREGETFLSAYDFKGASKPIRQKGRTFLKASAAQKISGSFNVEPFPVEVNYELILNVQTSGKFRIRINEKQIYEGAKSNVAGTWTPHTFEIPTSVFLRQNQLVIENIDDQDNLFLINYAVVRKKQNSQLQPRKTQN